MLFVSHPGINASCYTLSTCSCIVQSWTAAQDALFRCCKERFLCPDLGHCCDLPIQVPDGCYLEVCFLTRHVTWSLRSSASEQTADIAVAHGPV